MTTASPHDTLIYIMVVMSAADRSMTDSELSKIGNIINTLPVFDDYDADKVSTSMSLTLTLTSCQTCACKQSPELSGLTDKMRHRVRRPKSSTSMSSQTGLR